MKLYTSATPNGHKATIMLEEVGLPYEVHPIKLDALEQKQDWYLAINPNGRIPALVDDGFAVFESGAILIYLAEKTGKLLPTGVKQRSLVMQWLMFQMSGVGPMQGQAGVFLKYAPEKIDYAIKRYTNETQRLYGILDKQLAAHPYLANDEYSIADIATYPWIKLHDWIGLSLDAFPHLAAWLKRIDARPAVQKGLQIPNKVDMGDAKQTAELVARAGKILI